MSKKKKKNKPSVRVSIRDLGDGKIEVTSLGGGILGIKRRTRTINERANISKQRQWLRCLDYFRGRCAYCLRKPVEGEAQLTKDHFIPKSRNGRNSGTNIVPACEDCNTRKGNIHPDKWCTEEQLERIHTYFWDFRFSLYKSSRQKQTIVWKAIGLGE